MWDVRHSGNLFRRISVTLNEMLNVDTLDLRVTRAVGAADGGRM